MKSNTLIFISALALALTAGAGEQTEQMLQKPPKVFAPSVSTPTACTYSVSFGIPGFSRRKEFVDEGCITYQQHLRALQLKEKAKGG